MGRIRHNGALNHSCIGTGFKPKRLDRSLVVTQGSPRAKTFTLYASAGLRRRRGFNQLGLRAGRAPWFVLLLLALHRASGRRVGRTDGLSQPWASAPSIPAASIQARLPCVQPDSYDIPFPATDAVSAQKARLKPTPALRSGLEGAQVLGAKTARASRISRRRRTWRSSCCSWREPC